MADEFCTLLPEAGILAVTGAEATPLLQSLLSNDLLAVPAGGACWTALLTPQGKYLAEMMALQRAEGWWLVTPPAQQERLMTALLRYRLRRTVAIAAVLGHPIHVRWAAVPGTRLTAGIADPRCPELGTWHLGPAPAPLTASPTDWQARRWHFGIAEGDGEALYEQSTLHELNYDHFHGVSFRKGCYPGQEPTARTQHRGLVKRRLMPVQATTPLLAGQLLSDEAGRAIGEVRCADGLVGLALLRLELLPPLPAQLAAGVTVTPPRWWPTAG